MIKHVDINSRLLFIKIKSNEIALAGNRKLKIYGLLHCPSGKRIKKENRVFFSNVEEALERGYRPCGHCMNGKYKDWKNGSLQKTHNGTEKYVSQTAANDKILYLVLLLKRTLPGNQKPARR